MLFAAALLIAVPETPFPERVPGMIEACVAEAVAGDGVSETEDSHKYICSGEPAVRFWAWLEGAGIATYEQDTKAEGRWLGREFPLGACFKRLRMADGTPAGDGLSCTIWVPRPVR